MALLPGQSFDSSKHKDMNSFEALPPGTYPAQVSKSEIKKTKAGDGLRLVLTIEVISGEYKGRTILNGLNIENPNSQAVEISQQELATLCRAVNVLNLQDSEQLHKIPFMVSVRVIPDNRGGDHPPKNDITGYEPYSEKVAGTLQAKTEKKPTTTTLDSTPSWLKKENEKKEKLEAEKREKDKTEKGSEDDSQKEASVGSEGEKGVLEAKGQPNDGQNEMVVKSGKFDDDVPY